MTKHFVSLGMFMIDDVEFAYESDEVLQNMSSQIGGGGTYAVIGARVFLSARDVGMIVDKGEDFPDHIEEKLVSFGRDMWYFRPRVGATARATSKYVNQSGLRFEYLTLRIRIYPNDLLGKLEFERPKRLHFVCSPTRALEIYSEINSIVDWSPITIFEPIPDSCVPEELPTLISLLPVISILSPNAEEAFALLGTTDPVTKSSVEMACQLFIDLGNTNTAGSAVSLPTRYVIIRCGSMGACMLSSTTPDCLWVEAFWQSSDRDMIKDVTGAGNAFLGGLAAGLALTGDNVHEAMFYATVSASFIIQQFGLPSFDSKSNTWNGDSPFKRLDLLRKRHNTF